MKAMASFLAAVVLVSCVAFSGFAGTRSRWAWWTRTPARDDLHQRCARRVQAGHGADQRERRRAREEDRARDARRQVQARHRADDGEGTDPEGKTSTSSWERSTARRPSPCPTCAGRRRSPSGDLSKSDKITGEKGHRYVFSLNENTEMAGRAAAKVLSKKPYVKYWIAGDDYEYGHAIANGVFDHLKSLNPKVQLLGQSWWKVGETDFTPTSPRSSRRSRTS